MKLFMFVNSKTGETIEYGEYASFSAANKAAAAMGKHVYAKRAYDARSED